MLKALLCAQLSSLKHQNNKIWVAYSGGVDSHVLLVLAKQLFDDVSAIHINHKVSILDDCWEQHCRKICDDLQIPLLVKNVELDVPIDKSIEDAARNARRTIWQETFTKSEVLLLAHHAEDQAETILFRLCRGSGVRGLVGMRAVSTLGKCTIMRPLLTARKNDILEFANKHSLSWIEDSTNQDLSIDRNFLRHKIIPLLNNKFNDVTKKINRTSAICAQMLQGIEPQVNIELDDVVTENGTLDLLLLQEKSRFWQIEIVRAWLLRNNINPSKQRLQIIFSQVIAARIDAKPQMDIAGKSIRRSQNKLYLLDNVEQSNQSYHIDWDILQPITLPDGKTLSAIDIFTKQEKISRLANEHISVRLGVIGRKAKKLFQQYQIPIWERNNYPLVFVNNRLASIVGLWNSPRI